MNRAHTFDLLRVDLREAQRGLEAASAMVKQSGAQTADRSDQLTEAGEVLAKCRSLHRTMERDQFTGSAAAWAEREQVIRESLEAVRATVRELLEVVADEARIKASLPAPKGTRFKPLRAKFQAGRACGASPHLHTLP